MLRPELGVGVELGPGEPERLVSAEVVAVAVDRLYAAAVEYQLDAVDFDVFASFECGLGAGDVERDRLPGSGEQAEHVFLNRQAGIDLADGEDRSVGVAGVAQVGVGPSERERFGEKVSRRFIVMTRVCVSDGASRSRRR